jgi:hypothetical protein
MALAKLHNFCIEESNVPVRERFHTDIFEGDEFFDAEEQYILLKEMSFLMQRNSIIIQPIDPVFTVIIILGIYLKEKNNVDLTVI